MPKDGKRLEALVAYVENVLVPDGFTVTNNSDVRDADGIPIAEFDVEIRGVLGTTEIAWLIECRDRPSEGPAPASWVEQLIGRRVRFNLSRVTAVSTTGFSRPAIELANAQGIELREVAALTPEDFSDWLKLRYLTQLKPHIDFTGGHVRVCPPADATEEQREALGEALRNAAGVTPLLVPSDDSPAITVPDAINAAINFDPRCVGDIRPNDPPKPVSIRFQYTNPEGRYRINTALGPVAIAEIQFVGHYAIKETLIPLADTSQYSHVGTGKPISQIASFRVESSNRKLSIELHRIEKTGETHVLVRPLGAKLKE